MFRVISYEEMYGQVASGVIYEGDKATAKAIARYYNKVFPECVWAEVEEVDD